MVSRLAMCLLPQPSPCRRQMSFRRWSETASGDRPPGFRPLTRNWVLCGRASAAGGGLCRRLGGGAAPRAGGLGLGLGRQAASAGVTVMTQPGLSFWSWRIR